MPYILRYIFILIMMQIPGDTRIETTDEVLEENYEKYKEPTFTHRRFKHADLVPLVKKLSKDETFKITKAGKSFEGRDIFLLKAGTGKTKVLLWSQMHGDEATATMALFDIFNFLKSHDELDSIRQKILQNCTLYFLPMLNPDGAEIFTRRNLQDIDINRDAVKLQSPEANILKKVRDQIDPDFGFNLHDQNTRYSAGQTANPATISFLAPPYDKQKSENEVRENAMKLIVHLNKVLQKYIPNQVGKFSDDFEPRAFGDNFQKWGTSTVLIESGGYLNDPEKQYIRKLNFIAILSGMVSIADHSFMEEPKDDYFKIPENDRYLFDLVIRNAFIEKNGAIYQNDIGINRYEINIDSARRFYYESKIEEIGDMSVFAGYEEFDAEGLIAEPGKMYPEMFKDLEALQMEDIEKLLRNGYTSVRINEVPRGLKSVDFPINVIKKSSSSPKKNIDLDAIPNFILKKNNEVEAVVINGFVYHIESKNNRVKNGLVF